MGLKIQDREGEGYCGTIMAGEKTGGGATSAAALRIRENQRRSRARRKEYVESMERKVHEYERRGIEATLEMQQAARTVAIENSRLRVMLSQMGASAADVEAFLQTFQDRDAAQTLSSVRLQATPNTSTNQQQAVAEKRALSRPSERAQSCDSDRDAWPRPHAPPLDKLDVLASASVRQGCCNGAGRTQSIESPSTVGCAVTPSSSTLQRSSPSEGGDDDDQDEDDEPIDSPMEMSCDAAAQIIAEMQGYVVKEKLGCNGQSQCLVNDTMLFRMLGSNGHF